jgi:hypothetical protein
MTRDELDRLKADAEARLGMTHVDGVAWHEAPLPRRWHRCKPQTSGRLSGGSLIERCACGAVRYDGHGVWIERNQRRRRAL